MGKVFLLSEVDQEEVVTETEAESLVVQDSERILRENGLPRLCFNPGSKEVLRESRLGTNLLVPQDPLISGGGIKKNSSSNTKNDNNIKNGRRGGIQNTTGEGNQRRRCVSGFAKLCRTIFAKLRFGVFIYLRLGDYIVIMEIN